MDGLGDWELLDFYGDTHSSTNPNPKSKRVFQFDDYFSPNSNKFVDSSIPIHFNHDPDPEITKLPIESAGDPPEKNQIPEEDERNQAFFVKLKDAGQFVDMKMNSPKSISPQIDGGELPMASTGVPPEKNQIWEDPDRNQVFFVKLKETDQFADMKTDSPKSILPQIDAGGYQFNSAAADGGRNTNSPRTTKTDTESAVDWETESGGEKMWKWSLNGIGALCSFGVAVATVCVMNLGTHQRTHQKHQARFQIYASEKRIKQVLDQATRLNEVITGTRGGAQLGRAQISYGGHRDVTV